MCLGRVLPLDRVRYTDTKYSTINISTRGLCSLLLCCLLLVVTLLALSGLDQAHTRLYPWLGMQALINMAIPPAGEQTSRISLSLFL